MQFTPFTFKQDFLLLLYTCKKNEKSNTQKLEIFFNLQFINIFAK